MPRHAWGSGFLTTGTRGTSGALLARGHRGARSLPRLVAGYFVVLLLALRVSV